MNNLFKLGLGLITAYFFLDDSEQPPTNTPKRDNNMNSFFFPPVEPMILRNDDSGDGHFHASRSQGTRLHKGYDLICFEGQNVVSPLTGKVIRPSYPYKDKNNKVIKDWKGILISGTGQYSGYLVWMWYFVPYNGLIGNHVQAGEYLGDAQAISKLHGYPMKDHIHIQVKRNGQFIDPAPLLRQLA